VQLLLQWKNNNNYYYYYYALGIQHAMRLRNIVKCDTIFNNKNVTKHEMRVFSLQLYNIPPSNKN